MRERLSVRIDAELLRELRSLSKAGGTPINALVGEALADLLAKYRRAGVMKHYHRSVAKFGPLYERLGD